MKNKNVKVKIFLILLFIILLSGFAYAVLNNKISLFNSEPKENENQEEEPPKEDPQEEEEELPPAPAPKLKIIDLESKTRPIALMIDNETPAWPHAGLQDAFLIYEIIIEGGQTRLMAIFKDKGTTMIGPIRSARHYFVDYALESDAIFTHFGFSPQAQNDIKAFGVNNISGTQADGSAFWREQPLGSYHNVFTSISNLTTKATSKGYSTSSEAAPLLNYSIEPVDLSTSGGVTAANNIRIDYSSSQYVSYEYDPVAKTYKRYMRGTPHVDRITGAQYTFKNIIVYKVNNYSLNDGSGKGRQGIENIGSGDGYYITEGNAIPIKWEKASRTTKTIYKDLTGNEIKVNDGNTFIHLQPLYKTLTIQ